MPALFPGGDVSYLDLYAELSQLGLMHGRDFRRRNGGRMGWYFEVSGGTYQAWLASKGASGQSSTAEKQPVTENESRNEGQITGTAESPEESNPAQSSSQRRSGKKER